MIEKVFGLFVISDVVFGDISKVIRTLQPPYFDYGIINQINHQNGQGYDTTPTTFLPEIIINRNVAGDIWTNSKDSELNNVYIPPHQLTNLSEFPKVYIPPENSLLNDISINFPPNKSLDTPDSVIIEAPTTSFNYLPPSEVSHKYLPPPKVKTSKSFPPKKKDEILRLELNELRCVLTQNGYFKVVITPHTNLAIMPTLENDSQDPKCDPQLVQSRIVIHVNYDMFGQCGVEQCADRNLCLKIRFPQIAGMRTFSDSLLTLQCKIQEKIVSQTHAFRLGVFQNSQAKSIGTHAKGGTQLPFRTQIGLYRMTYNGYTKVVEPGGVVQLGEELMLRANIKADDGWNHSRVSDVLLQRLSPTGQILNSATIISSNGCVNPSMTAMCPQPPIFEPPLGHALKFRAVMFRGMKSGDEMAISAKLIGCLDQNDCHVDKTNCDRITDRTKRDVGTTLEQLLDVSQISFRVEMGDNRRRNFRQKSANPIILISLVGILCISCIVALVGVYLRNRNKF